MRRTILWVTEARAFGVVGFAVILAVMLWVAATAPPATMPSNNAAFAQYDKKQIHYFALGDSVASGYGLEGATGACHRTLKKSYPGVVSSLLAKRYDLVNTTQLACSGATADELKNQVDAMLARSEHITDEPILVSITIGANDFGFSDPNNLRRRLCNPPVGDTREQFDTWVGARIKFITDRVRNDVKELLKKPNVKVVITEFYNPANEKAVFFGAGAGRIFCPEARSRMDDAVKRVNSEFVAALENLDRSRVHRATIYNDFVGHEAPRPRCGRVAPPKGPWIQGEGRNPPVPWDCVHPNVKGAEAIGKAVDAAAIAAGLKRNGFILLLA